MIDAMSQDELEDLLDYLHMLADPDELTPEEETAVRTALGDISRGEYVTQDEVEREFGFRR
jgi:hypothetical protein